MLLQAGDASPWSSDRLRICPSWPRMRRSTACRPRAAPAGAGRWPGLGHFVIAAVTSLMGASPIRCRASGLKHAIVSDQVTQGIEVPAVECLVEPLNSLACLVIHRNDLPLATEASRSRKPSSRRSCHPVAARSRTHDDLHRRDHLLAKRTGTSTAPPRPSQTTSRLRTQPAELQKTEHGRSCTAALSEVTQRAYAGPTGVLHSIRRESK
jgi:hypothetical protein